MNQKNLELELDPIAFTWINEYVWLTNVRTNQYVFWNTLYT